MQEKVTLFVRRGFFRCFRRLGIPAERYCEVLCGIVRYCAVLCGRNAAPPICCRNYMGKLKLPIGMMLILPSVHFIS